MEPGPADDAQTNQLAIDGEGRLALAASFDESLDFDGQIVESAGDNDIVLVRLASE